jgi:hypothetical protein
MLSEPSQLEIYPRKLYVTADRQVIGVGLTTSFPRSVIVSGIQDSAWVHLASLGGKFRVTADSLLVTRAPFDNSGTVPFQFTGLSVGTDTLVLSSDGFDDDSMLVVVRPGVLTLPANAALGAINEGDSALVTLELRDATGAFAQADVSLLLNFSTDTLLAVSDGTAVIGSLVVDPGANSVSFWVKGLQAGTSELMVTSTQFQPFRFVITTRSLPGDTE